MSKNNQQKVRDLNAKIAFYRRNMSDQIKSLPAYFEENGPGHPLRVVVDDIIQQNSQVEYCQSEIQRLAYEADGLFFAPPTSSGTGVLPARP